MRRVGSIKEVLDIALELPAGADPYEVFDFEPYFDENQSEEELRKSWRVFTKVKDVLSNGLRLENASWRLWFKERNRAPGTAPTPEAHLSEMEKYDIHLDKSLSDANKETDRIAGDMFSGGIDSKFREESVQGEERAKAERTKTLLHLVQRHQLSDAAVNDIFDFIHSNLLEAHELRAGEPPKLLPRSKNEAELFLRMTDQKPRPRVAAFCHSLERNGANNFLLYLLRELADLLAFDIVSPKEGVMRVDYEALGITVRICDMKLISYPQDVRLLLQSYSYAIANTIMTTEVINAAQELSIPCLWVIHEAWPQNEFNYYAKEVFMMTHLDEHAIRRAFSNASKIAFPARVQRKCYEGLFNPDNARVIYNGIPLASINSFRILQSRDRVRADLGYGPDDVLLLHMGTVCKRKGQLVTCQAFADLASGPEDIGENKEFKLLMVGARYIRPHEIEYINQCKNVLVESGAMHLAKIHDVQKHVLKYYLAADIVLCPSLNEVLPLVICEAMAFERPVIATRIDGIPEALTDGVEGLLIDPEDSAALHDAILKLAKDPDLRARMGVAGRERVLKQFSFGTMSAIYRETIAVDLPEINQNADEKTLPSAFVNSKF